MHDGQLGRARIAEQMSDAFIFEKSEKCRSAADTINEAAPLWFCIEGFYGRTT